MPTEHLNDVNFGDFRKAFDEASHIRLSPSLQGIRINVYLLCWGGDVFLLRVF